ncbi:uncharacterized protein TRIVIDRAFT_206733 [Trichoderma virens Gv29-8]|uniref:Uncharacterized protein n=1 Tax=Hypocrea virens (strain Gv29-8 / FGSC 10586) TaxID=413071 RepID=G9NB70_HYPVG|nr:uncharacterized protein TRIVIDRAFT_206733 [Trichoderma virens Gv29-8]EHK16078.1 hypothetical protein TRIVIDRAFT_206733 [Trichoderma virens Gv29-8]UKZ56145.1 hypothetical protein TrVGV298_009973 [Trichoderma virens]
MSSSSCSIDGSNSSSINSGNTTTNTQLTIIPHFLDNPTYNLDRFLGRIEQIPIDQQQRPPPGLGQEQDGAKTEFEAETKAKERILMQLQEFDDKFGHSSALSRG